MYILIYSHILMGRLHLIHHCKPIHLRIHIIHIVYTKKAMTHMDTFATNGTQMGLFE